MSDIKEVVRQKYGEAALRVTTGGSSCCGAARLTAEFIGTVSSRLRSS